MTTPVALSLTRSRAVNAASGKIFALAAMLGVAVVASPARADAADPAPALTPFAGVYGDGSVGVGADAATGTARASYPIVLPPARGAPQPILSLTYAHTARAITEVGASWSLGLPVIERRAIAGGPPTFTASDVFHLSGARLVPVCVVSGTSCATGWGTAPMPHWSSGWKMYRPEIDSSYTRIFQSPNSLTWRVQTKSGEILELGVPLMVGGANYEPSAGYDYETPTNYVVRWKLVRQYEAFAAGSSPVNLVLYSWRRWTPADVSTLEDIYYTPPVQAHHSSLLSARSAECERFCRWSQVFKATANGDRSWWTA